MKGLVFRELYLGRKNYIPAILIWLLMILFEILISLSIYHGNLSRLDPGELEKVSNTVFNTFTYATAAILVFSLCSNDTTVYSDHSSGFMIYAISTPVRESVYVGVRYIIKASFIIISFVLSVLNSLVMCRIHNRQFEIRTVYYFIVFSFLSCILCSLTSVLSYKYKSLNKVSARIMLLFIPLYFICPKVMTDFMSKIDTQYPDITEEQRTEVINKLTSSYQQQAFDFISQWYPLIILVSAAVMFAGYYLSVRQLKRRDQ